MDTEEAMPDARRRFQIRPMVLGYMVAVFYLIFKSLSVSCVQGLQCFIPDFQLGFFRYVAQLGLPIVLLKAQKISLHVDPPQYLAGMLLGFFHVAYNVLFFAAVSWIPLSAAGAAHYISLMISVAVLCRVLYNKPIGFVLLTGMLMCFVGITCVSQPEVIFGKDLLNGQSRCALNSSLVFMNLSSNCSSSWHDMERKNQYSGSVLTKTATGYIVAVASGIPLSFSYIITGFTLKEINPVALTVWIAIFGLPVSLIVSLYFEEPVLPVQWWHILLLLGHMLAAVSGNMCTSISCQLLGPMRTAVVFSLTPVIMLIPQYTVMKHIMPGHGNWIEVVGVLITIVGIGLSPTFDFISHRHTIDHL